MKKINKIIDKKNPYLIAEIGVNHHNNIQLAEKIIKQAKKGGADAVKFQTYKAESLASKKSPYYWDLKQVKEKSQYKLFKKFDKFNQDDYIKLKKISDYYKIDFLSTPFDLQSANFLNKLVKFFKIASADFTNLILIEHICKFNKPILLSTGASNMKEISKLDKFFKFKYPNIDLVLLHCVLAYPTKYEDANLNIITLMKKKFPYRIIGYSDHTLPDPSGLTLLEAFRKGAQVIEKHFTLDTLKGKKGNDHFHSVDYNDLLIFRKNINFVKKIEGSLDKRKILDCEKKSRLNARRSLYSLGVIEKNEKITLKKMIAKRPGTGISPIYYKKLIGKKSKKKIFDDHQFKWSDFY